MVRLIEFAVVAVIALAVIAIAWVSIRGLLKNRALKVSRSHDDDPPAVR